MPHTLRVRSFVLAALLLVALAAPAAAAWSTSPWTSTPICTAPGGQNNFAMLPDGVGGAFIAWWDQRAAATAYATHVTQAGSIAPGWPVNGRSLSNVGGAASVPQIVAGTSGDVYVLWQDIRDGNFDLYAQRVLANGSIAPGWPAGGFAIGTDTRHQTGLRAAPDGAGGFYAVWMLEYTAVSDYDIYATRVLPTGAFAPGFALNGVPINGATLVQESPAITADGTGNAVIVYADEDGSGNALLWAQKLTANGNRVWGTSFAGTLISASATNHRRPSVVSVGPRGVVVGCVYGPSFSTAAYFAQVDSTGGVREFLVDAQPTGGQRDIRLVPDGAGGVWASSKVGSLFPYQGFLEHLDARLRPSATPPAPVYNSSVVHPPDPVVLSGGAVMGVWASQDDDVWATALDAYHQPLWPGTKVLVAGSTGVQYEAHAVSDGNDGAIVAWTDTRTNGETDLYASRIDRFGALGDVAPAFTRLADVPNDQGGFVSLQWARSPRDASPSFPIARYSIWRRVPGGLAALRASERVRMLAANEPRPEGNARMIRAVPASTGVVFWEYVAQLPARGYPGYSAVVATIADSMPGANPRTSFRVEAEEEAGIPYWDSAPDSAYSVDNLAPAAPQPFTGTFAGGTATLLWSANGEPDLGTYRLHRGNSPAFVPGPGNLVTEQSHTGFVDPAGSPFWYKLAAVDVHGNASAYSTLLPSGVTGAEGPALPREVALAAPAPNPARGAASLRFALPRPALVRLAIFDTAGRRVRTLADGEWPAGEHVQPWDGRGESGARVGAGLYFARLEADGRVFERSLVMIR